MVRCTWDRAAIQAAEQTAHPSAVRAGGRVLSSNRCTQIVEEPIFNGIDNKEQATRVVRYMRYPQQKTSKYQQPPGLRGFSPGNAIFAWGISEAEYERRADVWPLNPEGDLLAIPMIETADGLKNVNDIATTPGIGAIFIGAGSDLRQWLGVPVASPEVEEARQTILKACLSHNVPCGITATTKADVDKRLAEGWKMIRTGRAE